MVVTSYLMPRLEPMFDDDSYGYRPSRSALDAVACARQRTWQQHWVIDLGIKGFFDNLDHELLLRALKRAGVENWCMFYGKRWLQSPLQLEDGRLEPRTRGMPQGGVISSLLANLFLYYAFDAWMRQHVPSIQFIRYADDILVHCVTKSQAEHVLKVITQRLADCRLTLHPRKTRIVYGGMDRRYVDGNQGYDFLGFTFRRRLSYSPKTRRGFVSVLPAISNSSKRAIRQQIRQWKLHKKTHTDLRQIAKLINPVMLGWVGLGWVNYYWTFYPSELTQLFFDILTTFLSW